MKDYHGDHGPWVESDEDETCALCPWRHPSSSTDEQVKFIGQLMTVLHVILKHPDHYHRATGKNPEAELPKYLHADPELRSTQIVIATSENPFEELIKIGAAELR